MIVSEQDLKNFFDLSPDLIAIVNGEGNFVSVNSRWKSKLGYSSDEMIGRPFLSFVHPDDIEKTQREAKACLNRKTPKSFENRYIAKDGSHVWLEWRSNFEPQKQYFYCIVRDITEQKKYAETHSQLLITQREAAILQTIRNMTFEVTNDISSPLFAIGGHAEVLEAYLQPTRPQELSQKKILSHLDEIKKSIATLNDIFRGLNRITHTGPANKHEMISLRQLIDDIVIMSKRKLAVNDIELEICEINPNTLIDCNRAEMNLVLYQSLHWAIERVRESKNQNHKKIGLKIDKTISHLQLILVVKNTEMNEQGLHKLKNYCEMAKIMLKEYGGDVEVKKNHATIETIITLRYC